MQIQKNLNSYDLYSNNATGMREKVLRPRKRKINKAKRRLLYLLATVSSFILFATAVVAFNVAFDGTVFASSPEYGLEFPKYSSSNAVFAAFKPNVNISVVERGGDKLILSTETVKLSEVLEEQNIEIDDSCIVNHSLDTTVYEGMEVTIDSITYEEVSVTSAIPYSVKEVELQTIPKGSKKVITKGSEGEKTSTFKKKYINGEFESEELLSESTTKQPTTEIVEVGVGGSLVGKDGKTYTYSYYIDCVATAYGKADGSGNITATGSQVREGVVAVDPRVIPFGTKMYITGNYKDLGVCYAEDTGGAIKGNRIDVWMDATLQEMLQFGRRNMRVYILD